MRISQLFTCVWILSREVIEETLPNEAHHLASNRLHISITDLKSGKNHIISRFTSREELVKVRTLVTYCNSYACSLRVSPFNCPLLVFFPGSTCQQLSASLWWTKTSGISRKGNGLNYFVGSLQARAWWPGLCPRSRLPGGM